MKHYHTLGNKAVYNDAQRDWNYLDQNQFFYRQMCNRSERNQKLAHNTKENIRKSQEIRNTAKTKEKNDL